MQHPEFERVRELVEAAEDARRPTSFARQFDSALATNALQPTILTNYAQDLARLDPVSWRALKAAAVKRLIRNKAKGWEPLFDILSEAKGAAYLAALGCTAIQLIPPSYDYKTPDLRADLNGGLVLCEVKTINMANDERTICTDNGASQSSRRLSEKFLNEKFTWILRAAQAQLDGFAASPARKIVYVVFNPDEALHEYADDHSPQLKAFLNAFPLGGVEVKIFQFPGPHSATT